MADLLMRARTNSRTQNIRVKADPGTDANLMPVHYFRTIFPYLYDSSGQPKEGVLEKAESSFESYSSDSVTDQDLCKEQTDSAVHDNQDLCDCQTERSHASWQCCMPVTWTNHHAL